jgi:hypothetical protein
MRSATRATASTVTVLMSSLESNLAQPGHRRRGRRSETTMPDVPALLDQWQERHRYRVGSLFRLMQRWAGAPQRPDPLRFARAATRLRSNFGRFPGMLLTCGRNADCRSWFLRRPWRPIGDAEPFDCELCDPRRIAFVGAGDVDNLCGSGTMSVPCRAAGRQQSAARPLNGSVGDPTKVAKSLRHHDELTGVE